MTCSYVAMSLCLLLNSMLDVIPLDCTRGQVGLICSIVVTAVVIHLISVKVFHCQVTPYPTVIRKGL